MTIIRTGPGLKLDKKITWIENEEEEICVISLDGIKDICEQPSLYYEPDKIAQPGDVLMINERGSAEWIIQLRNSTTKVLENLFPP